MEWIIRAKITYHGADVYITADTKEEALAKFYDMEWENAETLRAEIENWAAIGAPEVNE